jgi:hypothetical protein
VIELSRSPAQHQRLLLWRSRAVQVVAAVTAFVQQQQQQLQGVPVFAVGASSGGAFVLTLPHFLAAAGLQLSGECGAVRLCTVMRPASPCEQLAHTE